MMGLAMMRPSTILMLERELDMPCALQCPELIYGDMHLFLIGSTKRVYCVVLEANARKGREKTMRNSSSC
jgi:hypothetical protein